MEGRPEQLSGQVWSDFVILTNGLSFPTRHQPSEGGPETIFP
ncbi:hypothetical protein SBA5_120076 [Candidatus Sulfotelmatomonas gaucii]|uniref:Uncharacterized protein n=1 Tax=Candidatus Sulfuritelmatomonas gaucii TaxID=2043161 RepID=A0A2N9L427_9BACT|nr:hypothetical protein SBA5_120076 [Candidatus Sulfotelmatomonas gaucii]